MNPIEVVIPGFLYQVAQVFERMDHSIFFGCYRYLAGRSDIAVRQSCARNFPAVLKMAGPDAYANQFHDTFAHLAADEDEEVRRTISSQFHEVRLLLLLPIPSPKL